MAHERVPYDDPESRGDLYILAPMRLLTPVIEETDSDITKSKLYQSLASVTSQVIHHFSSITWLRLFNILYMYFSILVFINRMILMAIKLVL